MKPDERALLIAIGDRATGDGARLGHKPFAGDLVVYQAMHEKRAAYILLKWADRGWWEYGVTLRSGWLTEAGVAAYRAVFAQ